MNITESILKRRSVRTYTREPLDTASVQKITDYIATLTTPFGAACRIVMINTSTTAEPVKLGTYGFISGATDYLALIVEGDDTLTEAGGAYVFEQVVLYCTLLGLGTCWLGGSFNRGDFKRQIALRPGEKVRIVSPVGYASDKRHLSLISVFGSSKPKPRKPFEANFFDTRFGDPLTEAAAGVYARPLEMVRLAPSANNKQSWRVIMDEGALYFYKSASYGFDNLDVGIALCHFEQTCIELEIKGHYEVLADAPEGKKAAYVISWIIEKKGIRPFLTPVNTK